MKSHFVLTTVLALLAGSECALGLDSDWQGKMKNLADTVGQLLPELVSAQGDPKVIERGAKTLSELSHDLEKGRKTGKLVPPSDLDPSVAYLADRFSSQARRAYSAIQQGNLEQGKTMLKTITSYCIACHTRHEKGPEFATFPLSEKTRSLGPQEKAELYVATRQFDKGLAALKELVADQQLAKQRPLDWERPFRSALAISVRVKRDPDISADLVATALRSPALPEFEKTRVDKWGKAIAAWKKEPRLKTNTEAGHAAEMRRLLKAAIAAQTYPVDRSAEIQYLRASGAAHDVLRVGRDPKLIAEALFTAGSAYEVLANPLFWPMHEFYYEACIRKVPHSAIARDCYARFEQSVHFGYTGSSGTFIPPDIQQVLTELKALSASAKPPKAGK